ncbi:unnamed protein product [Schistocephalus solidus]|uniref:NPC1_N domain-containing protein n=1 Tax=Schistocephalus solidus TaxID=70667 RepID=A0A183TL99_SCHSO|nr:unnamed protein product [Schistocephalus solidus]
MLFNSIFCVVSLLLIHFKFVTSDCVMHGACDTRRQLMCQNITQPVNTSSTVKRHCPNVKDISCCSVDQIQLVTSGLSRAEYWMGKTSQCFQKMRNMFCEIHCDANQSQIVEVLKTDKPRSITGIRVQLKRDFANEMFRECAKLKILWIRIVDQICIQQPCNAKEFFRSLGATESMGGSSPYLIEFQFID